MAVSEIQESRTGAESFSRAVLDFAFDKEAELSCRIGLSMSDPSNGLRVEHRGDELFHPASTMKVPVMVEVFRRAEAGDWSMDEPVVVDPNFRSFLDDSPYVVDSGKYLATRIGQTETMLSLVEQMIVVSDNLATNLLIRRCGPARITGTMRQLGIKDGFVLRGVQDIPAFEAGLSNRMTPNGLTRLMEAIENGEAAGPASTEEMKRILLDQHFNDMIPRYLPEGVRVGHKTGSIKGHRHDTAIVYAPDGSYFLTIMVAECDAAGEDEAGDDPAKKAAAEIARLIHEERAAALR